MSLGTNISRLRAEHHLSQGDLAEALAVSRQSVSKWETDSSVPDLDKLVKLSQVFDVTLDELVMGAEPRPKAETPPQQVVVSHRMPGRKIAGTILFCMGFLAFLIPTVLGGLLTGFWCAASSAFSPKSGRDCGAPGQCICWPASFATTAPASAGIFSFLRSLGRRSGSPPIPLRHGSKC